MATAFNTVVSGGTVASADINALGSAINNLEKGIANYFVTTGSANAYAAAPTPALSAYPTGHEFRFKANFSNTGAATIAVSGLSAQAIKRRDGSALIGGEIVNDQQYSIRYDGTNYILLDPLIIDAETPSGTIDSSNTAFTLANAPLPVSSLQLFYDGNYQVQGVDYTITGAAITYAVAPTTSKLHRAHYRC
jgi:hypothetical protein